MIDIDPEKDMPLPERLKVDNQTPTVTEEPTEAPVQPLEAKIEASKVKKVIPEPEVVEPDSEEIIKARKNAHQAMLRR